MEVLLKCHIPLKVKIFVWMAVHYRNQCGVQLKKEQWSGPKKCFGDKLESTYHILFFGPFFGHFFVIVWVGRCRQLAARPF
jgi:hypothetical protein